MRNSIASLFATTSCAFILSSTAFADDNLPNDLAQSLKSAISTGDSFIIDAVASKAKSEQPHLSQFIDSFIQTKQSQATPTGKTEEATQYAALTPAAGTSDDTKARNWDGSLEAGANFATGNTEREQFAFEGKFNINLTDKIVNESKFTADSDTQNDIRSEEEYRFENKTKWLLSDKDYAFFDFEYNKDRFSNQDFRISELIGYGRDLYKNDSMSLKGEVSVGLVQTEFSDGDNENSEQYKLGTIYNWDITKGLSFAEELTYSINPDFDVLESDTYLKSALTENLYLKLSFNLERVSDVPEGTDKTDTITKLTVGYDF